VKLISHFHDYYDTALAHGIDMSCVYERKEQSWINYHKEFPEEVRNAFPLFNLGNWNEPVVNFWVGFCYQN